jgi:hypothetical protein
MISHWIVGIVLFALGVACLYVGVRLIIFVIQMYVALYRRVKELRRERRRMKRWKDQQRV